MDEADELADRICIMSHGKLLTLDTSHNIKKKFGVGYNLMIEPTASQSDQLKAESNNFNNALKKQIDAVVFNNDVIVGVNESNDSSKKKLIYTIPLSEQKNIPRLLEELE